MPNTSNLGNSINKTFTARKRMFTMLSIAIAIIAVFFGLYYSYIKHNEYHYQESRFRSLDANFEIIKKQLDNKYQELFAKNTDYKNLFLNETINNEAKNVTGFTQYISGEKEKIEERKNNKEIDENEETRLLKIYEDLDDNFEKNNSDSLDNYLKSIKRNPNVDINEIYNLYEKFVETKNTIIQETINSRIDSIPLLESEVNIPHQFTQTFDEQIIFIVKSNQSKNSNDSEINKEKNNPIPVHKQPIIITSLKGAVVKPILDSLKKIDPYNIGATLAIPKKNIQYQLFSKNYTYNYENKSIKYEISMVGFIETERYNSANRKLDAWIIAIMSLFLLLAIFGLPYFKMLFIAEDERVSNNDVILSGISIIVGAPILILVFFSLTEHYYDYTDRVPSELEKLSTEIKKRFEEENKNMVNSLNAINLIEEDSKYSEETKTASFYPKNAYYSKNFKFIAKVDNIGKVDYYIKLIFNNGIEEINNLQTRPYFKAYNDFKNIWSVENNTKHFITELTDRLDSISNISNHADSLPITKSFLNTLTKYLHKKDDTTISKKTESPVETLDFITKRFNVLNDSVEAKKSPIKYSMSPVVSIEDDGQKEELVYVLENKFDYTTGYRIGAAQLSSVHETILPFGYQFAIINKEGDVWFHSEKRRATLENLENVSREHDKLFAAVAKRVSTHGKFIYREQGHLYHIQPIKGTDLSVMTFFDIDLLRTQISEVLTMSCIVLLLAFLIVVTITILSLIIRNPKLGLYKYDTFRFDFLTPKKKLRHSYFVLSVLLLISLIFLATVANCLNPVETFFLCLLVSINSYLIIFYTLHRQGYKPGTKYCVRDLILLSSIILLHVLFYRTNDSNWSKELIISVCVQSFYILYIIHKKLTYKKKNTDDRAKKTWWYTRKKTILKKIAQQNAQLKLTYKYWYALFMFLWLALASIYPSFLIFQNAKEINDTIWLKIDQYDMSEKYLAKELALRENLPAFDNQNAKFQEIYKTHLDSGQYHHDGLTITPYVGEYPDDSNSSNHKKKYLTDFIWAIRPQFHEDTNNFQSLVKENADDSSWLIIDKKISNSLSSKKLVVKSPSGNQEAIRSEVNVQPKSYNFFFHVLNATGLLIILAGLFSLILFFTDRFYAFRFNHLSAADFDINPKANYLNKFKNVIYDEDSNSGLLLIGPPFSGKKRFADKILKKANYKIPDTLSMLKLNTVNVDTEMTKLIPTLSTKTEDQKPYNLDNHEAFIIDHLEHNIKSYKSNHLKLKIILFLIASGKRIILLSEVYPSQIFAMYENPPENLDLPWGSIEDDFNSWRNILGAFPQVLISITKNPEKIKLRCAFNLEKDEKPNANDAQFLLGELGYSNFLPNLAPIVVSKSLVDTKKSGLDRQRLVMHIQNLAHGYYNDIWNTLPTRERYMLYDLAKDGFMNIKNRNSLFSLMKKGLIVWRDRPRIFNNSFRNFIVTSVSLNEALRLENKNRGKGSWANTRILLYLIIVVIIVFIGLGNPEFIKDFESLLAAFGGLGVVIPLVSRMLASSGQK
ncbi:hypothetical protein [Zobellia russellii]|uniref:hypothetical protein n=1 Tax=Zobellia russellii TaxID=248907 RepID=UPI001BFF3810|nr:hypothetical protein [Zobellia russellii]MBT9187786.1 hypothetical protein [Zobellia russellii]